MLITRRMEFSAAHQVEPADLPASHGHNYLLEVSLRGPVDEQTGMLIDLKHLKDVMDAEIAGRFDHRNLNEDTPYFRDHPPTGENFASLIFELLDAALPAGLLYRVRLAPAEDHWVEVTR